MIMSDRVIFAAMILFFGAYAIKLMIGEIRK